METNIVQILLKESVMFLSEMHFITKLLSFGRENRHHLLRKNNISLMVYVYFTQMH